MPTILPTMSCPATGTFYACALGSRFLGCCSVNPCSNTGCPAGNLLATIMTASQQGLIPDEDCESVDARFYTCNATVPTFWGCCKGDPCVEAGCEGGGLVGARLWDDGMGGEEDVFLRAYNGSFVKGTQTQGQSSSVAGTVSATAAAGGTSTAAAAAAAAPQPSSSNIGAIAGGAVGGLAILAALIFSIIFFLSRRRRQRQQGLFTKQTSPTPLNTSPPAASSGVPAPFQPQFLDEMKHLHPQAPPPSPSPSQPQPQPQPPFSPNPPTYHHNEQQQQQQRGKHISYELPGSPCGQELESGQIYHPYRQSQASSSMRR